MIQCDLMTDLSRFLLRTTVPGTNPRIFSNFMCAARTGRFFGVPMSVNKQSTACKSIDGKIQNHFDQMVWFYCAFYSSRIKKIQGMQFTECCKKSLKTYWPESLSGACCLLLEHLIASKCIQVVQQCSNSHQFHVVRCH